MSNWIFEDGHLIAKNEDGHELGKWMVEINFGEILASILNVNQCFSNQLLTR